MTALTDPLTRQVRARLERERERELAELARLMRQPGSLAEAPEPPPLHCTNRDTATERTTVDRAAVRNVVETSDVVGIDDVVYANYPAKRAHPYEKPAEVLGHILARVCRRGDLVLDPFAGSGSCRVAAEKLGLDLVWKGCDIDPQFAETKSSYITTKGTIT